MRIKSIGLSLFLVCGYGTPGLVFADLGDFTATQDCPAVSSIKKGTNPGGIEVKAHQAYSAITLNKAGGDYVQVRISGASPEQRWVKLSCGELQDGGPKPEPAGSKPGKFLLAISWQPAFCESTAGQGKRECDTATPTRFDASHFTLHGLWPQPRTNVYCKVPTRDRASDAKHDWDALPEPVLSAGTHAKLDTVMPGTVSNLQRHEWTKHGTCFGTGPEAYFRTALALMEQVNTSKLQELVAENIGKTVAASDMKTAFEQTFGPGSAAAISIECDKDADRTLISGISINLQGTLNDTTSLQEALDTSARPKSRCSQAVVDPVGLN